MQDFDLANDLLVALWFFLPAAIANVTPIFLTKIFGKKFAKPLDFGKSWRGKRILGDHKTWRGLAGGIIFATIMLQVQVILSHHTGWADRITDQLDFENIHVLIVGPLFAIGALGGDAIESFIKRRLGKKPGTTWFPFDQIDYVIGAMIATWPFATLNWWQYVFILIIWTFMSLIFSWIGRHTGFKGSI